MTYQDDIEQTAQDTAAQVAAAFAAWQAGQMTTDALVAVVAAFIATANSTAAALADLSLAATISVQTGEVAPPLGIVRPADDAERLRKGTRTILDDLDRAAPEDQEAEIAKAAMRIERLARAEALEAAARAYSEAIKESSRVTGWTRGVRADACQLCRWWHRDGQVWPDDHPMPTHKGCTCNPIPVTTERKIA